jgi:LacI family transcriptional regulator
VTRAAWPEPSALGPEWGCAAVAHDEGRGLPRLSDVATAAGVDRSVVSRVVNDDPSLKIRPETRERILQAIRTIGYRPNAAARSLRTSQSRTIGLVIPDYGNPVYAEIISGAETAARAAGHLLLTGSVGRDSSAIQEFMDLIGHGRVDRLIIAGVHLSRVAIAELEKMGTPWLLVNSQQAGVPWTLSLDDRRAASVAVLHLVELGHRRIAFVHGPSQSDTARRRYDGYKQAMEKRGIAVNPALVVRGDYTAPGGRLAMQELLEAGEDFTAILAGNLPSGFGAVHEASRRGIRVPDDMSIIAVHNLDLADYLLPSLTTVRLPLFELGRQAVGLILTRDGESRVSEVIREPLELMSRGSTGPVRLDRATNPNLAIHPKGLKANA